MSTYLQNVDINNYNDIIKLYKFNNKYYEINENNWKKIINNNLKIENVKFTKDDKLICANVNFNKYYEKGKNIKFHYNNNVIKEYYIISSYKLKEICNKMNKPYFLDSKKKKINLSDDNIDDFIEEESSTIYESEIIVNDFLSLLEQLSLKTTSKKDKMNKKIKDINLNSKYFFNEDDLDKLILLNYATKNENLVIKKLTEYAPQATTLILIGGKNVGKTTSVLYTQNYFYESSLRACHYFASYNMNFFLSKNDDIKDIFILSTIILFPIKEVFESYLKQLNNKFQTVDKHNFWDVLEFTINYLFVNIVNKIDGYAGVVFIDNLNINDLERLEKFINISKNKSTEDVKLYFIIILKEEVFYLISTKFFKYNKNFLCYKNSEFYKNQFDGAIILHYFENNVINHNLDSLNIFAKNIMKVFNNNINIYHLYKKELQNLNNKEEELNLKTKILINFQKYVEKQIENFFDLKNNNLDNIINIIQSLSIVTWDYNEKQKDNIIKIYDLYNNEYEKKIFSLNFEFFRIIKIENKYHIIIPTYDIMKIIIKNKYYELFNKIIYNSNLEDCLSILKNRSCYGFFFELAVILNLKKKIKDEKNDTELLNCMVWEIVTFQKEKFSVLNFNNQNYNNKILFVTQNKINGKLFDLLILFPCNNKSEFILYLFQITIKKSNIKREKITDFLNNYFNNYKNTIEANLNIKIINYEFFYILDFNDKDNNTIDYCNKKNQKYFFYDLKNELFYIQNETDKNLSLLFKDGTIFKYEEIIELNKTQKENLINFLNEKNYNYIDVKCCGLLSVFDSSKYSLLIFKEKDDVCCYYILNQKIYNLDKNTEIIINIDDIFSKSITAYEGLFYYRKKSKKEESFEFYRKEREKKFKKNND